MPEETAATPKIKTRKPKQRACDEKDDKGKLCNGHLKRWYDFQKEVVALIGPKAEIYRCEHCRTLYLPSEEEPRGRNVAGMGKPSVFGLTVAPKPEAEEKEKQ